MNWGAVILAVLKLVLSLTTWVREKQLMKAGEDAAIARAAEEVMDATAEGQRLRDIVNAYNEAEKEDLWRRMTDDPGSIA